MILLKGISLRHIGRYIPVQVRSGETRNYKLNPKCSFPVLKEGIGEKILQRHELSIAARLIGLELVNADREIRVGDKEKDFSRLKAQRTLSEEPAPINLLEVLRNAKGYDVLTKKAREIYEIIVPPEDARALYRLIDQNGIKRFWAGFESCEDIQKAQNTLRREDLLEAFDVLDFYVRADFWLVLDNEEIKEILLRKLDNNYCKALLMEILGNLWKTPSVRDSLESHFREYFKAVEEQKKFFGRTNDFSIIDISPYVTADEVLPLLLGIDFDNGQEILKKLLLNKYERGKRSSA